jgi:hypothetical protein
MSKKGLIHGGESTSHDSGNDILYTVEETGQQVLIEGDEYHLCKASLMNNDIHEYKNKTNKEILDDIYTRSSCMVKEGEANVGDFIICKLAVRDKTKRNLTGTIAEIVSIMQKEHGCRVVDGAEYEKMKKGGKVSAVSLAPNGKPSNLTPEQYRLVRTTAFKAWFGDWENDKKNASKVVDENGEPMVVYHGTKPNRYPFYVFDIYNEGAFFSEDKYVAKRYSSNYNGTEYGEIKSVFLNIRKPEFIKSVKYKYDGYSGADANLKKRSEKMKEKYPQFKNTPYKYKDLVRETSENKGHDGFILENHSWGQSIDENSKQYAVFNSNQIKLADGTNTTFNSNNPDIRFKKGGYVRLSKTPAPKKERIYGSKRNPKGTSESGKSAESIEFSESTLNAIKNKVEEHNKKHPEKKITLDIAKAVVRRGMGAYSSTHRPTIKGGKPNSRVAWGLARLNAFIYKVVNGKSKSGRYSEDNDLLDELGIKHQRFANGGTIDKRYVAEADFYVNAKNDDQAKKEANEVAKLIDDKYDNKATVNHLYEIYGGIGNSRKVFKDGGSFQPPYPINASGGYDYKGEAKETAKKVDLLTLPKNVSGTHCGNCFFFQQGICSHKGIMLPVTDRMCCSVWDNSNSERSYEKNIENDKAQPKNDIQTFPKNKDGGYTYSGEALKIAEKFDLITLPKNIEGTNCANCSWYTPYKDGGFCFRSNIQLPVNARMSCTFWNSLSVERDWGFFEKGGEIPNKNKIYRQWRTLVNMTALELQQFYDSQEGIDAGLKPTDARDLGIDYGRKSARWILKMKKTAKDKWTNEMWNWANKQISFIKRMSGNKGKLFDDKGNKTRKHTSLLIWGHNPLKQKTMEIGGIIEISKKHRIPISIILKKYIKGVECENKYATANAAMEIAKINLMQDPNYYNVIELQMKNGGEFKEDSFLIIAKHIFKEQIDDIYGFLNLPNDRFLIDDDLFYFSIVYVKDEYGIVYSADYFVFNDDTDQQIATGSFDFKTRKFNLLQLKKFLNEKDETLTDIKDIAYDINIFDYFFMKLDYNAFIHKLFSEKDEFSRFGRALQYRIPKKTLLDLYPNIKGNVEVFSIIQEKVKIGDYIFLDLALANEFREKNEMLDYSINKLYIDSENVIALNENLFVYSPKVFRKYVGDLK